MAMIRTRKRTICALIVALVSGCVITYQSYRIYAISQFNEALQQESFTNAGRGGSAHHVLADAYALQQTGRSEEALAAYALVDEGEVPELAYVAKFNTAGLYLERALEARESGDHDLAIPLIELAKESYRQLLRINSNDWESKYNLERALQLLPELEPEDYEDDIMPERSPRALLSAPAYDRLP